MRSNRECDYFGNVLEYEYDYFALYSSMSRITQKLLIRVHEYDYCISGLKPTLLPISTSGIY